jgi:Leucine-rich repeat (LRR) protein
MEEYEEPIEAYLTSLDENIESLDISFRNLTSLPDLNRFKKLKHLNIDGNNLTEIPELPNTLLTFSCRHNQLTSLLILNLSTPNLKVLDCGDNRLTVLSRLPSTIEKIFCRFNLLSKIEDIPVSLIELECMDNELMFEDLKSLRILQNFRKRYYLSKFGSKLERYYVKNVRNKRINQDYIDILFSPDFGFYKRFLNSDILKYFLKN